ncbi:hypothetical protein [Lelliottia amnigena]|uniref:hypothetical protein n=1 Tax=Lelliottia amnigena TaxID=61646 RepID=UPI001ED97C1B|nr:hypothetical protein [Lelliottia amnigena]
MAPIVTGVYLMRVYANRHGDSGVQAFEFDATSITVEFPQGWKYLYNDIKPGPQHVEEMKKLATDGAGLNGYINKFVRSNYARKYQ